MVKNVKKVGWRFLGYRADGRNMNIAEGQKFFEFQFASSVHVKRVAFCENSGKHHRSV